jgi:hypothetical protein
MQSGDCGMYGNAIALAFSFHDAKIERHSFEVEEVD